MTLNNNGVSTTYNVTYGEEFELPVPVRAGYTFIGWYSGKTLVESGVWTYTINKTFNAKWAANTYTVTYVDPLNRTVNTDSVTFDAAFTLPTPAGSPYTNFVGWYAGETLVQNGNWNIASDTVLTAKWDKDVYTLTLVNGDTETSMPIVKGQSFELPVLSKEGYRFVGWFNGSTKVESGVWTFNTDVTLVAKFEFLSNQLTLIDHLNGTVETTTYAYGESFVLADPADRVDATFLGWFDGDTKVESGVWNYEDDKTFVARWEINTSDGETLPEDTWN